jgi:hypothetical protein
MILAQGFKSFSEIIECCVGTIDGTLIWIHKPDKNTVDVCGFGPKKFFCGRKKFGLNMQAICDAARRFLNVERRFSGSTFDYFAFEQSK